ncbi:MAG TPA: hypothetical protein VJT31_06930, partial [Rugosimonospora sp.]|nr:hypothetical protein [Rugosimonospora sp.]
MASPEGLDAKVASIVAEMAERDRPAFGRDASAPAADSSVDYQYLNIAKPEVFATFRRAARQRYPVLMGKDASKRELAWQQVADVLSEAVGIPMLAVKPPTESLSKAVFDPKWVVKLPIGTRGPHELLGYLVHDATHAEITALKGRFLAGTDDPDVLKQVVGNADVRDELRKRPLPADHPLYPLALRLWSNHVGTSEAEAVIQKSVEIYTDLLNQAYDALRYADAIEGFDPVVLGRLERRRDKASELILNLRARYFQLLEEALAYQVQRLFEALGSVRDWSTLKRKWPGYQVEASPAGAYWRPVSSPRLDSSPRLAHPDRPLESVPVHESERAEAVLDRARVRLPDNALVELVPENPIDVTRAIELTGQVGKDQVLMLAASRIAADGPLPDNFVPYTWSHQRTLGPKADYYTVHATPQTPDLVMTGLPSMRNLGGGEFELSSGWRLVQHGRMIWLRPAHLHGTAPIAVDKKAGMPEVLVGVPGGGRTPWAVAKIGLDLARILRGNPDDPIDPHHVQVHNAEPEPPEIYVKVPDELIRAVDEQDKQMLRAFGEVDAEAFAFARAGNDVRFDVNLLADALLSVAGGDLSLSADERVGVLATLADSLDVETPDLLPAGYLAARAYGIGGLTKQRLAQALALLSAWRGPGEPLGVTEESLADIVAAVTGESDTPATSPEFAALVAWVLELTPLSRENLTMEVLGNASDHAYDWLDGLPAARVDRGVWWLGEGKPPKGLIPVSGHLVVAFSAGPDLLPVGTS